MSRFQQVLELLEKMNSSCIYFSFLFLFLFLFFSFVFSSFYFLVFRFIFFRIRVVDLRRYFELNLYFIKFHLCLNSSGVWICFLDFNDFSLI